MSRKTAAQLAEDRATLIQEIEHLLNMGEGEHAITHALQLKPASLERQLFRIGRPDLVPRIFTHQTERRTSGLV